MFILNHIYLDQSVDAVDMLKFLWTKGKKPQPNAGMATGDKPPGNGDTPPANGNAPPGNGN